MCVHVLHIHCAYTCHVCDAKLGRRKESGTSSMGVVMQIWERKESGTSVSLKPLVKT